MPLSQNVAAQTVPRLRILAVRHGERRVPDILLGLETAKAPNLGYILPEIGYVLTAFNVGIIVSVAAFGGSMWAQFALNRRRNAFLNQK